MAKNSQRTSSNSEGSGNCGDSVYSTADGSRPHKNEMSGKPATEMSWTAANSLTRTEDAWNCVEKASEKQRPKVYHSEDQITDAVVQGRNLSCPYYEAEPKDALCNCGLTPAIRVCNGLLVEDGFPCVEGREKLRELNGKVDAYFRRSVDLRHGSIRVGVRLRNGTLRRR